MSSINKWNPSASKQKAALLLAIEALTRERRRLHAAGEAAYQAGHRKDVIQGGEVSGEIFAFAEDGHIGYVHYSKSIQELEDLIEIVTDPPATIDPPKNMVAATFRHIEQIGKE
jgi:hypothetical protein